MPANVTYPFWIVSQRLQTLALPVISAGSPGYVAAFSTAQKATEYMLARGETAWEFKMVTRPTFLQLAAELRTLGLKGICFDPAAEACGRSIDFDQFG